MKDANIQTFSFLCALDMEKKGKAKSVLLGMSGGTDSSVAAMLLQDAGFSVTGVTFRFYERDGNTEYLEDAKTLASRLGIEHITYDAREIFHKRIVDYFIREYMNGNTPVPCVLCNNYLKWPLLAKLANERGIQRIATGHYARCLPFGNKLYIYPGNDTDKDQSFFLWGLPQDILQRMELPLGEITKVRVREIAAARGFSKAATKKDSIGVCFCPGDYRSFLREHVPAEQITPGFYEDLSGKIIGKHEGYPFYTIGQRRGLGINFQYPVFVKETNSVTNRVVLSPLGELYKQEMWLKDWNLTLPEEFSIGKEVICKIRYRKQATPSVVTLCANNLLHVRFLEPLESIAVGQAAAFYEKGRVTGGGIIAGTGPFEVK